MNPRRLLPYVMVFLVLAGAYAALRWHQGLQEAREQEAKQVFKVQEKDIGPLTLIRDGQAVRLVKKDHDWHLAAPLTTRADQAAVDAMLVTLAQLKKERDLGAQKDLKPFGLDHPRLVVEFTAQGKSHRLALGSQAPGDRDFYALKDQEPNVLLISTASKDSLDRSLPALRDKTLLAFDPGDVKGVRIKARRIQVDLEKTGAQAWRWVGREGFKVRPDRVAALLRELHAARVKEFPEHLPKNYWSLGLAPRPRLEVTLVTAKGSETLLLGTGKDGGVYARKGADGPVVLVDQKLEEDLAQAATTLEDRRLWGGPVLETRKVVWGPPGKSWTATQGKEFWEIKGPEGQASKQPAARLELALWKLQNLEYGAIWKRTRGASSPAAFVLEVFAGGDQPVFRLEESGQTGNQVQVKAQKGDQTLTALVPAKNLAEIRDDLARLTAPTPKPPKD
jgi:hypothetical protein